MSESAPTQIPQIGFERVAAAPVAGPERLEQLDALRGLAAMAVVLGHFVRAAWPAGLSWEPFTPFHLFVAGQEAVVLFFVLSGFVLLLPYQANKAPTYPIFLLRRVCRIYLPYLAALAVAIVLNWLVSRGGIPELGTWFNQTWTLPISAGEVRDHILFLGKYKSYRFNTAFWSLIYEMRISLVFPFLVLVVRASWKATLWLMAGLTLFSRALLHFWPAGENLEATLSFAALFLLGALVAWNRQLYAPIYQRLSRAAKAALLTAGILLYNYGQRVGDLLLRGNGMWLVGLGAALVIALAISSRRMTGFLHLSWIRLLGAFSYSLYLLHGSVLFATIYLLYPRHGWILIFCCYLTVSLLASYWFYRWVEVPSMALGKTLSRRIVRRYPFLR